MQITMAELIFVRHRLRNRSASPLQKRRRGNFQRNSGAPVWRQAVSSSPPATGRSFGSAGTGDPVELFAPEEESRACFTRRSGETAVTYLMELAAGLHSQILVRIRSSRRLKRRFPSAARGGRRAFHIVSCSAVTAREACPGEGPALPPACVPSRRAVALLEEGRCDAAGKRCMVIGNGEMGRATATLLRRRGAEVWMTLRQYHKGKAVIPAGCSVVGYDVRYTIIGGMDYVYSATRSPHKTVRVEAFAAAQQTGRTYGLVDLAVPRDMDPALRTLPGVRLYDLDAFGGDVRPDEERQQAVASEIAAQADAFADWYWFREWAPSAERIGFLLSESTDARLRRNPRLEEFPRTTEQMRAEVRTAVRKSAEGLVFGLKETLPGRRGRR